jgi:hypothetical protein
MKNTILSLFFITFTMAIMHTAQSCLAGAGKSFGLFAGGFGAGALTTYLIKSRNDRRAREDIRRPVVIERERPVYIQTTNPGTVPVQNAQNLRATIDEQTTQIRRLEREKEEMSAQVKTMQREQKELAEKINNLNAYRDLSR